MVRGPRHIKFNDHSSEEFGIIVNSIERPILPALRSRKVNIPGMDGAWDFGSNTREEITILVHCTIADPLDNVDLEEKIAVWLSVKSKLIMSDLPYKYYIGRIYDIVQEDIKGPLGTFTLSFVCDPTSYSLINTLDDILLGADIPLGTNICLDPSSKYTFTLTDNIEITMENSGVKSVRPQIIVNGSFESFYFEINGIWLAYPDPITNQELIIDCSNYDSTLDGLNVVNRLNGDVDHFLTLSPGNNNIRMRGVSLSCTVKIGFRPTYY